MLLAAIAINAWGDIQPGARYDQVIQELGIGYSSTRIGNTEILSYKNGIKVRFEKGVVTEITQRGQIGATRVIRYRSPTALILNQKLAANDLDLQDRSDHHRGVQQGGKTSVLTVHDDDRAAVLKFDGQDAYLRVAQPADLNLENGLTLCAWVKPESFNQQSPVLEWEKDGAHVWLNAKGSQWGDKPSGINWAFKGAGTESVVSTTNPPTGQWTHVAVSFNAQSQRGTMYLNGERVAEKRMPAGTPRTEGDVIIGARPSITGDARFHGLMDDIRIIQRAMDEGEIRQIMGPVLRKVAANAAMEPAVSTPEEPSPGTLAKTKSPTPPKHPKNGQQSTGVAAASKSASSQQPPPNMQQALAKLGTVLANIKRIAMGLILLLYAIALFAYVFSCYCYKRICQKAGQTPGALIWIPIVQFIPLLRVARMADWMLILLLIPIANIVAMLILWARICLALNKSPWLAATLLVPGVNLALIPYLAFSRTDQEQDATDETQDATDEAQDAADEAQDEVKSTQ